MNEQRVAVTEREAGIDLAKATSMLMVVALHILGFGGVLEGTRANSWNYWLVWLLESGCYCAVNCFALATGYLMVGRQIKYRKLVSLWLVVFFYSVVLVAVGIVFYPGTIGIKELLNILPVTSKQYWYFTAYFCLFLFIPYINRFIDLVKKKEFYTFLIIGLILFSFSRVFSIDIDCFELNGGYSVWWLIYLYFLGAGIKKHKLFGQITLWKALFGYLLAVLLTWGSIVGINFAISLRIPAVSNILAMYGAYRLLDYTSPTILAAAVCMFMFFKNLRLPKNISAVTCRISPLVFQVYIIHRNNVIWENVIKNKFVCYSQNHWIYMVLQVIGTAMVIFFFCICIDFIRQCIFKWIKIEILVNSCAEWVNRKVSLKQRKV